MRHVFSLRERDSKPRFESRCLPRHPSGTVRRARHFAPHCPRRAYRKRHRETRGPAQPRQVETQGEVQNQIQPGIRRCAVRCGSAGAARCTGPTASQTMKRHRRRWRCRATAGPTVLEEVLS